MERELGVKAQLSTVQPGLLCTDGFHMQCYRRFTDKTKIARADKPGAKRWGQPSPDSFIDVPTSKSARNVECSKVARQVTSQR